MTPTEYRRFGDEDASAARKLRPVTRHEATELGVVCVEARPQSLPADVAREVRTLLCRILVADMREHPPASTGTDNPRTARPPKHGR